MFATHGFACRVYTLLAVVSCGMSYSTASAADLLLTDGRAFPGQLFESRGGAAERSFYRREATANPAFPRAAMKLAPVAIGPDRKIYFASGLDGYVQHLLDRTNEVVSFEFNGQIRDLDSGNEEHTVYFSVVPTPQNNEPLSDGKIYRRDIWQGQPSEVATIRQSDVGGNWWGSFTIKDGIVYITTLDSPSRIFKLTSAAPEVAFPANRFKISGLTTATDGFYFADDSNTVYRTSDFENVEPVLKSDRKITDVAVEPQ
jgi:hypothetical protein